MVNRNLLRQYDLPQEELEHESEEVFAEDWLLAAEQDYAVNKAGDEIEVRILRVDTGDRKIGLSQRAVKGGEDEGEGVGIPNPPSSPKPQRELRGGTGSGSQLFSLPASEQE